MNTTEASVAALHDFSSPRTVEVRAAKPLSLTRNALWTMIGTGAYAAAQWLQVFLIAHLGTASELGQYALALGIATPIFMFFNLQLRQIQVTDARGSNTFPEYLGLRAISSFCGFGVVCLIALFCSASLSVVLLAGCLALFKAAESLSEIYQGALQQQERMDYVGCSLLIKSGLILSAFGVTYFLTRSLIISAASMICAQVVGLYFYDMRACDIAFRGRAIGERWAVLAQAISNTRNSAPRIRSLAVRAFPLGVTMMLISLYANLPRFVLERYSGVRAVGVFAAITYIPLAGTLLITAVGTSFSPRLSKYAYTDRSRFRSLLLQFIAFNVTLGGIGILTSLAGGSRLLTLLYGAEYARHTTAFTCVMVASALNYVSSAFGFAATSFRSLKPQPWIMAGSTLVLLVTTEVLVPQFGITGAAIATICSTFTSLCGYVGLVAWKLA